MAYLELNNICKSFHQKQILKNINLTLEKGAFVSLLGKSGCGKTTLLRIIAGLEKADAGSILLNGEDITAFLPQQRNFGFVFQNYALFPHMNVFQNVGYGLKIQKMDARQINIKVGSILEKVALDSKAAVNVSFLSGGEQQRVALARAIVTEPQLLLLDEPLSNLDFTLRVQARNELKRLQKDLGITTIYVTHDQSEALALSDKIEVMNEGSILQSGTPEAIYHQPDNIFTASFVGRYNLFNAYQAENYFQELIDASKLLAILPEHLMFQKTSQPTDIYVKDILFTGATTEFILTDNIHVFKTVLITGGNSDCKIGDFVALSVLKSNIKIVAA